MHRTLRNAVLASFAVAALHTGAVQAEDHAALETLLSDALEETVLATQHVAEGDRAAAAGRAGEAVTLVTAFRTALKATDSRAALGREFPRVRLDATTLASKLKKAQKRTDDPLVSSSKAAKSLEKATRLGLSVLGRVRRIPAPGLAFVETNARSAGFHEPATTVGFTVLPGLDPAGGPCTETPVVQVVDLAGNGAIQPTIVQLPPDARGHPRFQIQTGSVAGAGRVEVTACGVTRRWLLFNRGAPETFSTTVVVTADRFDGSWTGSYSGRATLADGRQVPFTPGTVAFSVAGGVMTVTDPGSGTGSISPYGKTQFAGRGASGDTSYSFQGTFTSTFSGAASASGNWFARFNGGTAQGTWKAAR